MKRPIPVTVVSGFLGSGKTTLLCDLLERRQERRLAVLINEFGEVSIDGALARAKSGGASEVDVIDFPSGLIAYAEDGQFVPTLQAIARKGRVDHVLIETSGVALPSAAMARLQSPELASDFVLDATLVVVDTPRLLADEFKRNGSAIGAARMESPALAQGPVSVAKVPADAVQASHGVAQTSAGLLFDQQLMNADVVVLNKIDELETDELLAAEEQVRQRAPNVRFLELARNARLDVRVALGLRLHQAAAPARGRQHLHGPFTAMPGVGSSTLADHRLIDGHSHSGLMAHSHGLTTHTHFHEQDPGWLSFTLRSVARQDVSVLRSTLERVAEEEPLLRCKGFARCGQEGRPVLLQGVRTRVAITEDALHQTPGTSELVFIGYHLSRARVASMLSRLTGTAWS